jgi:hypothetical protein
MVRLLGGLRVAAHGAARQRDVHPHRHEAKALADGQAVAHMRSRAHGVRCLVWCTCVRARACVRDFGHRSRARADGEGRTAGRPRFKSTVRLMHIAGGAGPTGPPPSARSLGGGEDQRATERCRPPAQPAGQKARAWPGESPIGTARHGTARHGTARHGTARLQPSPLQPSSGGRLVAGQWEDEAVLNRCGNAAVLCGTAADSASLEELVGHSSVVRAVVGRRGHQDSGQAQVRGPCNLLLHRGLAVRPHA